MWSLPDNGIELGRTHTKVPRNTCEIPAIHIAKFTHLALMLEPVAEQINDVFDDRVCLDLGFHGALPNVLKLRA